MPRFLIDENMPRSTGRLLKEHGYPVEDVRDLGLRGIKDEEILQFVTRRQTVLLTADMGFANILDFPLAVTLVSSLLTFLKKCQLQK